MYNNNFPIDLAVTKISSGAKSMGNLFLITIQILFYLIRLRNRVISVCLPTHVLFAQNRIPFGAKSIGNMIKGTILVVNILI